MKQYEYIEIEVYDGNGVVTLDITSTTPEPIKWIKEEAIKINLTGKKGEINQSELKISGQPYNLYLKQIADEKNLPGSYNFIWGVTTQLCHNGWEPFGGQHEGIKKTRFFRKEVSSN